MFVLRHHRVVVLLVALGVAPLLLAQDGRENRPRMDGPGGFGRSAPDRNWLVDEAKVNRGFLFVEGEYVSPPYEIRRDEDRVLINGKELKHQIPEFIFGGGMRGQGGPYGPGGGGGFGGGGGPGPPGDGGRTRNAEPGERAARHVGELSNHLGSGAVVISFAGQQLITLDGTGGYDLLSAMTGALKATRPTSLSEKLPVDFDSNLWTAWLTQYKPNAELSQRASALIAAYDATEQDAMEAIAATRRLNDLAYPLTVGGMVLSVLAIGHLLGGRPHAGRSAFGMDDSPEMIRMLNWSLLLLAMLSAFDLAWTLLAAQADQIRELNPIGSHLIEDPRHLIGFKVGAIVPSIGLLWLLRRYKRAQVAAWWACLILTILVCRWSFISMNVAV